MRSPAKLRDSFPARAALILAGSALGQGIALVLLPLTARLYGANILGRVSTALALQGVAALVVCFQYDSAVVVARDDDVPYLALLALAGALAWSAVLLGLMLADTYTPLLGGRHLLASLGIQWPFLFLILAYSLFTVAANLRLRRNQLGSVSAARTLYYGGGALLQAICGFVLGWNTTTFLSAQALAALAASALLLPYGSIFRWLERSNPACKPLIPGIRRVARVYGNFPRYQTWAGLVNAVSVYMPLVCMRTAFSDAWAGWYLVAWRILASPATLANQAVGQVLYRDGAERERQGAEQGRILEGIVLALLRISLLPAILLAFVTPFLVRVALGNEWAPVGPILQVLLISTVGSFVVGPLTAMLNVRGLQAGALAFNVALFLLRVVALWLAVRLRSEMGIVWSDSLTTVAVQLPLLWYTVRGMGGSLRSIAQQALPLSLDASVVAAFLALLWAAGMLYHPVGILLGTGTTAIAVWREMRRWCISFLALPNPQHMEGD